MSEELIQKLRKDIESRGYPFELIVGNIFSTSGWNPSCNRYYLDKDEGQGREIDISSYKVIHTEKVSIGLHLISEVKYCAHPWVIFSTPKRFVEGGGWLKLHYLSGFKDVFLSAMDLDSENEYSSLRNVERIGRSYYEGFKKSSEKSVIFGALASVVKASEHCLEVNERAVPDEERFLGFVEPLIVVNQPFYEAYLNEQNELQIEENKHTLVSFGYISNQYQRHSYLVELVTIDELPNLLSQKTNWLETITRLGVENLESEQGKK